MARGLFLVLVDDPLGRAFHKCHPDRLRGRLNAHRDCRTEQRCIKGDEANRCEFAFRHRWLLLVSLIRRSTTANSTTDAQPAGEHSNVVSSPPTTPSDGPASFPQTRSGSSPSASEIAFLLDQTIRLKQEIKSFGERCQGEIADSQRAADRLIQIAGVDYARLKAVADAQGGSTAPEDFTHSLQFAVQAKLVPAVAEIPIMGKQWLDLTGRFSEFYNHVQSAAVLGTIAQSDFDRLTRTLSAFRIESQSLFDHLGKKHTELANCYRNLEEEEQRLFFAPIHNMASGKDGVQSPVTLSTGAASPVRDSHLQELRRAMEAGKAEVARTEERVRAKLHSSPDYLSAVADVARAQEALENADNGQDRAKAATDKLNAKARIARLEDQVSSDPAVKEARAKRTEAAQEYSLTLDGRK